MRAPITRRSALTLQLSYKAYATDVARSRSAEVVQYADPKAAATAAATLLFKNYPDEQSQCGMARPALEPHHVAAIGPLILI